MFPNFFFSICVIDRYVHHFYLNEEQETNREPHLPGTRAGSKQCSSGDTGRVHRGTDIGSKAHINIIITVAGKRGYTDLPETSSRQLPMSSSSD